MDETHYTSKVYNTLCFHVLLLLLFFLFVVPFTFFDRLFHPLCGARFFSFLYYILYKKEFPASGIEPLTFWLLITIYSQKLYQLS